MRLSPSSPLVTSARKFGIALRRSMRDQGIGSRKLAEAIGTGRTAVCNWRDGVSLPSLEMSEKLAEVLADPKLVELIIEARRRPCDACDKTFVAEHHNERYCSLACKRHQAKRAVVMRDLSRAVLQRRVAVLDRAVAAMCAECEPSGICRTPTCPLQIAGVSPHRVKEIA